MRKAWQTLWSCRALWLFGAVLALVGAKAIYAGPWPDLDNDDQWTKVKIGEYSTIRVPGGDMTVDLTGITRGGTSWREISDLVDRVKRETSIDLWPVLIELAVIAVALLLLGTVARYVAETAVIRMVSEAEESGRHPSVREGLRRGFSRRAGRLFLLDLATGVLAGVAFGVLYGLAVVSILLAIGSSEAVLIGVGLGTVVLFILATVLWIPVGAILSLVGQPIRRACALEDQSLLASIRQGVRMTKDHLKEVGLIWLIWIGIRLLWVPLGAMVIVLLAPVLLFTILGGVALGGVPAALVAAATSSFTSGTTASVMGALVGLPIFAVVTLAPMLFVSGFVEVYKSCIWTLAYRDLKAAKSPIRTPVLQAHMLSAPGVAD
jgi:hypothetical protein